MSDSNFKRRYIMKCGPKGSIGFQIGNINSVDEEALHISFSVEKSDSETCNTAKIQVWNLSNTNLNILDLEDCIVELRAGYNERIALILAGNVTTSTTTADNADRMTEIEVVDGRVELRDTIISVSFNGTVDCKEIYKYVADAMGTSILFADDVTFKTMPNGFSFVGKARSALQKVAAYCGHSWSIQNQIIQVTNPGKALSSRAYLLNSDTGLLGIPKRITIAASSDGNETKTGWEIQYFMNGAIGVNDIVYLQSNYVCGNFRVHKVTIDGDNLEGDWVCTAQVLAV